MPLPLSISTKIGRRMVLLFVVSALVPLIFVAVYGAYQVRTELRLQATTRLELSVRSVGMGLLDQLDRATNALRDIAGAIDETGEVPGERVRTRARGVFASAVHVRDGAGRTLWGSALPGDLTHLRAPQAAPHKASLYVTSTPPRVWMSLPTGAGRLWVELEQTFLFRGATDRARISSSHVELCVRADGVLGPLLCTSADSLSGRLSASWQLFLANEYGTPSWRIRAAESQDAVFAPIAAFESTFAWSVVAILGIVVLLSSMLVRRSLRPVDALSEGTKRLAERDFSTPVRVSSGDEFQDLADSFNLMGAELERQFRVTDALNRIDHIALASRRADDVAITTAQRLAALFPLTSAVIYVAGNEPTELWHRLDEQTRAWDDAVAIIPDAADRVRLYAARTAWLLGESVPANLCVPDADATVAFPLTSLRDVIGAVVLSKPGPWTADELRTARRLCNQLALGLSNTRLIDRLQAFSIGAIAAFGRTVDANSPWTAGHSERVTSLSLRMGSYLELPEHDLDVLHRGGLLHDIGKIGIPASVLDKNGPLTAAEREIVRSHSELGAKILAPIKAFAEIIPIVLHHHERFDGKGYPCRLAGDAIPHLARLLAVADVYDALVSDRPYRAGVSRERAIAMIREEADAQFDSAMVNAFLAVMTSEGDTARFLLAPLQDVAEVG